MNTMRSSLTMYRPLNKVNPCAHWIVRFSVAMLLVGCLSIATAQHSSVYAQETLFHTVRSGETMSSIADRYGVSVSVLASSNGISVAPWASTAHPCIQSNSASQPSRTNDSSTAKHTCTICAGFFSGSNSLTQSAAGADCLPIADVHPARGVNALLYSPSERYALWYCRPVWSQCRSYQITQQHQR
jgi:hypothetical protein